MAEFGASFAEMLQALAQSKSPLSVRLDQDFRPAAEELEMARRTVGHVMADADLRSRLPTLRVEPLVRAAALMLEDCRRVGPAPRDRATATLVLEYLTLLDKAFGNVPSILNNRGVARSMLGDGAGADADLASARRLAPAFIAPRVNEIEIVRRAGDFTRLERIAEEIERSDPGNVAALRSAVDAKIALRRPPADVMAAARRLHGAKAARPNDLLLMGNLSIAASDPAGAETYLRELVEAEPRHVEGHLRLAVAFLEQGKFPEAVGLYGKLTEIDGPNPDYWLAIASTYERMGRLDDALRVYDRALQRAADRDRDRVGQALHEFEQRHGPRFPESPVPQAANMEAAPSTAEPIAALPQAATPAAPPLDPAPSLEPESEPSLDEAAEPRVIGDTDFEGAGPLLPPGSAISVSPENETRRSAVEGPNVEVAASEAERLAAALDASAAGYEVLDDGLDEAPAKPTAPVPPALEHREAARAVALPTAQMPAGPDSLAGPTAPSEAITPVRARTPGDEAIVSAPALPESLVVARGPIQAGASPVPVVTAPAPPAPAGPAPPLPMPPPQLGPQVSSPPAPREVPDDSVTAQLEALERTSQAPVSGNGASAEPFRRPTFDVDEFMAALEARTKPVFDHLYDGMLEARRKETSAPPAKAPVSAWYESAPPGDVSAGPSAPVGSPAATVSAGVAATDSPAMEEPAPAIPLFLQPAAMHVQRGTGRAEESDPALAQKAFALAQAGDATAETVLDQYLAGGPPDARAWNLKGDLRERAGDEAAALDAYWKAVKYDAAHKEAWNNLGVLLHLLGRYDEAVQALESGTKVDPRDRHLWHNLGSTYHELGRLDDALSAFSHAIEVAPDDKVSHNNQGTTLFERGDFKAARGAFERAAALDPGFEQAHNNLGRTLEKLDDLEGAARSYQAALALNERSVPALRNLARVLERLGRSKEASALGLKLQALGA